MRSFFIVMVVAAICGCAKAPYFDLRHPVYFQAENSFWSGCDKDPAGEEACREYRVEQMYEGFSQWFKYFDETSRPRAVFVPSDKELPANQVNRVIHLGVSDGFCGQVPDGGDAGACYSWRKDFWNRPTRVRIIFKNIKEIVARSMAHEFGHALGMWDNYLPKDRRSVMSYTKPAPVTPHDMKTMCKKHRECIPQKRKRKKH